MTRTPEDLRYITAMWCDAALNQARRFEDAADAYLAALEETRWQATRAEIPSPHGAEWDAEHDADPDRVVPLTYSDIWHFFAEKYHFVLALAQVRKCVTLLPDDSVPQMTDPRVVKLLRDIEEHWEQEESHQDARSLRELRQKDPAAAPGLLAMDKRATWLTPEISVGDLAAWVQKVDGTVRDIAQAAGKPLPSRSDPLG